MKRSEDRSKKRKKVVKKRLKEGKDNKMKGRE